MLTQQLSHLYCHIDSAWNILHSPLIHSVSILALRVPNLHPSSTHNPLALIQNTPKLNHALVGEIQDSWDYLGSVKH